jgi:hypothetical protein
MGGGFAAGAAVPGIIRRRLQAGRGAEAAFATVDRGIQQFRERRPDRLYVGPVCLGFRRFGFRSFCGFLGVVGSFRHVANIGANASFGTDLLVRLSRMSTGFETPHDGRRAAR